MSGIKNLLTYSICIFFVYLSNIRVFFVVAYTAILLNMFAMPPLVNEAITIRAAATTANQ